MLFFRNNIFIRLLLPLLAGILIQYYASLSNHLILLFALAGLISFGFLVAVKLSYPKQYIQGLALNYILVCLGLLIVHLNKPDFDVIVHNNNIMLMGELINVPEAKDRNYKTEIALQAQKDGNSWKEINGTVVAYIEIDSTVTLKAGCQILFNTQLNSIKSRQNPFGFDYAGYMALKNVSESVYLKKGDWQLVSNQARGLRTIALNLRESLIEQYEKFEIKGDNLAVLSALTLGYKSNIDAKVRQAFSGTGAMHVLSVSGLHVGIIYIILNFIFSWTAFISKLKQTKFIIILIALWAYALLTGLSPSVLRATIMFSFVLVGYILNKRVSIYNSLAASAFFILLFNPLLIFDVGFQLSYFAVIGIAFFYPIIFNWFNFKNKVLNAIWALTVVSIAATLATFPIIVYNFHQFPTYFLLANIGVTYISFIILLLSMVFFVVLVIPIVASFVAVILNFLLNLNLDFLQQILKLPGAVISEISFSSVQVFVLYAIIAFLSAWLITKKYRMFMAFLYSFLLLVSCTLYGNYYRSKQNALCVYQVKAETAIHFVHQKKSVWITSKKPNAPEMHSLVSDGNVFWQSTNNSFYLLSALTDTIIKQKTWYYNSGFWAMPAFKGMIINNRSNLPLTPKDTLTIDYVFITGNPAFMPSDISKKIKFNSIVIDGSVPVWKTKQIISNAGSTPLYFTKEQGAFIAETEL